MRNIILAVALAISSYMAWKQFKPKPKPPPPPPPPAILSEPVPVINEAEQAKIIKSAEDQDPNVRWEAVLLLEKMKLPQALPLMFYMLQKDSDMQLRIKVTVLLGMHHRGPNVLNALVGALKDAEPEVRLAALKAIEKIGDYSVAPILATGPVKDPEDAVRTQALKTLNHLQERRLAEIEAARKQYEEEKRLAALEAAKKR